MKLGSSDLKVSAVAAGCMRMNGLNEREADTYVKEAMEAGINFFDHADIYGGGFCEELFGTVLKNNPGLREKIVLQSKGGIVPGKMYDNSKEYLTKALDASLKRLGTDHLDVYLIHRPDALAETEDTAEALEGFIRSGKVRYVGVSNHRSSQMARLSGCMEHNLMVNQLQFSLTNATLVQSGMEANMFTDGAVDRDGGLLDYCRQNQVTIQTWSPFQYGFFDGTFLGNEKFPELNQVLDELADKYSLTNTGVAAAWILRHPANMQLIAGTMKSSRLKDISKASDVTLSKEDWYRLYMAAGHSLP